MPPTTSQHPNNYQTTIYNNQDSFSEQSLRGKEPLHASLFFIHYRKKTKAISLFLQFRNKLIIPDYIPLILLHQSRYLLFVKGEISFPLFKSFIY